MRKKEEGGRGKVEKGKEKRDTEEGGREEGEQVWGQTASQTPWQAETKLLACDF